MRQIVSKRRGMLVGIAGASAVLLGAFGAHALQAVLDAPHAELWHTAVNYHVWHALALALAVGLGAGRSQRVAIAGFALGIVLFSGSLYALALGAPRWTGIITPFGGLGFIVGWIALGLSLVSRSRTRVRNAGVMPWHHHAGMKAAEILRKHPWFPVAGLSVGLVAIVLSGFGVVRPASIHAGTPAAFNSVMPWHDASHDWLLVADGQSNQLTVYNAIDGRPLHRLDVRRGVRDVGALAQRDGRLFVVSDDGRLGELEASQLQLVASTKP